jgi:hypothetical protein
LSFTYDGKSGWFDLRTIYFDENDGVSRFRLFVAGQLVDEWIADDALPDDKPNGHTSTRHKTGGIALRPGDEIQLEADADGGEQACVDYLVVEPANQ